MSYYLDRCARDPNYRRAMYERARKWKVTNREKQLASQRRSYIKQKYGLTQGAVAWMLEQQGGACATCDNDATAVDHDHETGHVRGLLCSGCNSLEGKMAKDAARVRRLLNYTAANQ